MRRTLHWVGIPFLLQLTACPNTTQPSDADADAATDATPDIAPDAPACTEVSAIHSLYPGPLYLATGATGSVQLRLARDRATCGATFAFAVDDTSHATVAATARIEPRDSIATVDVTAAALGRAHLTARQIDPPDPGGTATATIDVIVLPADAPDCPMTTPAATGSLTAGSRVQGAIGSPLEHAGVSLQASATTIGPIDVAIACAPHQLPAGYDPCGPAITFAPGTTRLPREIPFTIPVNPARVRPGYELQTEIAYTGPSIAAPRIVPLANTRFTADGTAVTFQAMRFGTYQAVIRRDIGTHHVQRHLTYHAILGISMGAVGSSVIGTRHPELFDVIAPLGGPADSAFSGDYLRRWVFGGFCTESQRAMLGDAACATTTLDRVPPANDLFVAVQSFEHFFAPPGRGTGGTFDRQARFQGFRDISRSFGAAVMQTDPANGILPLGVPASELTRTDAERCATPVSLGGQAGLPRFYDDEFNPTGAYPVITFCDGNTIAGMPGEWSGGQGTYPVEITLAVDRNRNGVRDAGEPVVRNFFEPYRDVGPDGLASRDEPGYDAGTNPDPAGDDYDRQYNPGGTEGNLLHDTGEPFDDVGLDGVACPAGETCPYDFGEGNNRFDTPSDASNSNPRDTFAHLPRAEAHRLAVWSDGGVRDALQFGVNANHFSGAIAQQEESLHLYNGFLALLTGHDVPADNDTGYHPQDVDYARLPRHSLLRYGFVDASAADIEAGDGAHVGTADQISNRLFTAAYWIQSQWPTGDHAITTLSTQPDNAGRCAMGYTCTFDFHSDAANRTAPVSVYLPPGYHAAQNADERYPVIFFLHGYGMQASDLLASGLLLGNDMVTGRLASWQRPAKFIMVFPDGRCRDGDGCLEGTFFTDSPLANHARIETYFMDLYRYVDANYRVRAPEDVDVVE